MAKRVALTYRFEEKAAPYVAALQAAGLEPVPYRPGDPTRALSEMAGLVVSGGTDINPALYRAARDPHTGDPDDERDAMEASLLRQALAADLPVLAICRGMQLFNVCHEGGTLVQHLEGHVVRSTDPADPVHAVLQTPGSHLERILGPGPEMVNSRHHQAVDRVGRGLLVASSSDDGIVEGLERPDLRFAVAVQWHPEDQVGRFAAQRRLFAAFADSL